MPRRPRNFIPGVPLHITQRGNNRQKCFFSDRDCIIFLDKLYQYSLEYNIAVHGFVLMTNHVHLLLTPQTKTGPSQLIQALGRYYVRYINSAYKRTGTLWEGRFKASLIDSHEYLLAVSRYIDLNPVRAKMVSDPAEYTWSSYQSTGLGKPIKLLTPHSVYLALGKTRQSRCKAYQALINCQLSEPILEKIRTATAKGWVIGNADFKKEVEQKLGFEIPPFKHGGNRKYLENKKS